MQNKRVLCAEDETPWETIKATSEVAGSGVKCVCVREGCWGKSITRPCRS